MNQYNQGPFNQQLFNQYSQSNNSINSNISNQLYDDNNYNHVQSPSQPKQQFNQHHQKQQQSDMMRYYNPKLFNQQYNQNASNSSYQSYTNSSNKPYHVHDQVSVYSPQLYNNQSNSSMPYNSQQEYQQPQPQHNSQGYGGYDNNNFGYDNQHQQYHEQPQQSQSPFHQKSHYNQHSQSMNNNQGYGYNKPLPQEYKQQVPVPQYNNNTNQNSGYDKPLPALKNSVPQYNNKGNGNGNQNSNNNQTWQQPDHTTHKSYNQYMPKQKEELVETKKAHIYNMRAHFVDLGPQERTTMLFNRGKLTVEVYDAIQRTQFRSEFTEKDFPGTTIRYVAEQLTNAMNGLSPDKNKISVDGFKPVSICEDGQWCYLTVNGVQIPTFALRPVPLV